MSKRILIVDDEPRYLRLLEANLRTEGYEVATAQDGVQALDVFSAQPIDLVLLDVMMPRLDGFGVCQRLREFSNVPIVILTARGEEQDPPVLRRAHAPTETTGQARFFVHGDLKIDFARAEVWRGEEPISLSATEYRLLLQFTHNVGKILTSEDLLTSVWGAEYKNDKEILWVSIARLRQKLETDAHAPHHIVTRSGLGYLMPPIEM